ncbi:MAG: hypothetical protein KBC43_11060 [Bacteroidales bacterium]|nr:hypothetical protein [Bacteroidales bacterium]
MKKALFFLLVLVIATSCYKQGQVNETQDKWNGYEKFLKTGEQVQTLWAGKNINVGTVTYGLDDNANFYAKYDCSASGWTISETHMFAGDKIDLPRNKPGSPKIGQFPNSGTHSPRVSTYTYYVPLSTLPPCAEPGFVVSAHCVVYGPNGKSETAWAEGDFKFTDKDWGWYDIYYYNQPPNQFTILYATSFTNDTLKLFHIDMTNGHTDLILKEAINTGGRIDAAAYDALSGMFFFADYDYNTLYANQMHDTDPSYVSGTITGKAASATFYNNEYYYVDEYTNTINKVSFNTDWTVASETILDTIPSSVLVNDITMNPEGTVIYMIGEVNGGGRELISWDVATESFYSMAISITTGGQIAYGSDGELYVIAPISEGGSHSLAYTLDPTTGTLTPIEDDIIIIDDPFSDLSKGPIL